MLLECCPPFNIYTFSSETPVPPTLRNKESISPFLIKIKPHANANGRVKVHRKNITVNSLQDQDDNKDESPNDRKLALASWLSNAYTGEHTDPGSNPTPTFKSIGTRSVPSRPSIPGKHSKYSVKSTPPRFHGEKQKPFGHPPPRAPAPRPPKFWRPVSVSNPPDSQDDDPREVALGSNGVAYRLPGAPFEYQYSYTETPKVKPLALREAAYVPFGPTTMPRPWTGRAPLPPCKKKIPEFDSFRLPPPNKKGVKHIQAPGPYLPGQGPKYVYTREEILGEPLTRQEVKQLVDSSCHSTRQLNIGRDGLTHNMLENIHAHWKRRRVCKIKCKGVATVDMDNICYQLEEKTGGKIIHRDGGAVYLFRGRNYNSRTRTKFPLMLWKPAAAVYPRLIKQAPAGLTLEEANEFRRKGSKLIPICKLGKNGVYLNLAKDVRDAFEVSELVRINCQGLKPSDYKKIGAKLKDLVPCVLLSFENEHILMWRGKDWKSMYTESGAGVSELYSANESPIHDSPNSSVTVSQPSDEKSGSEYLDSAPIWNSENMPDNNYTISDNVLDEASEDTAVAANYLEKTEPSRFSISEAVARVAGEVDYLEGKLNSSSSSEVAHSESSEIEIFSEEGNPQTHKDLDDKFSTPSLGMDYVELIESGEMENFSDEGNVQTHEDLHLGDSEAATNSDRECVSHDSSYHSRALDMPLFFEKEFLRPGEDVGNSGTKQISEDKGVLSKAVNETSFNYRDLCTESLKKSTESSFLAAEATTVDDGVMGSHDNESELNLSGLESAKMTDRQEGNGMFDEVDENEMTVHSTVESSQQNREDLEMEVLWQQAIQSGRALLLDEPDLDPDIVHEKAINFAKDAPQGPFFKRNFSSKKIGKPWKRNSQEKTNKSEELKTTQNTKERREEMSAPPEVSRGRLPLDELARLLSP